MLGLRVWRTTRILRMSYQFQATAGSTYRAASFKVDKKDLKERLTAEQYYVTQEKGTERFVHAAMIWI